jgi:hypothetical protein
MNNVSNVPNCLGPNIVHSVERVVFSTVDLEDLYITDFTERRC